MAAISSKSSSDSPIFEMDEHRMGLPVGRSLRPKSAFRKHKGEIDVTASLTTKEMIELKIGMEKLRAKVKTFECNQKIQTDKKDSMAATVEKANAIVKERVEGKKE